MTEWISVEDRLPDKNGRYLCCYDLGIVSGKSIGIYSFAKNLRKVDKFDFPNENRKGWYGSDSEYGYYEKTDVTHWMPLPELPMG